MTRRDDIVAEARSWIGTPYRHQASLKGAGCDCLGLIRGVWRAVHGAEPERPPAYAPDWAEAGGAETLAEAAGRHLLEIAPAEARPGDVLLFRWAPGHPAKHAGILSVQATQRESARFIHAYEGQGALETRLVPWWARRLAFAYRFPSVE
ncbi:NlpC/P60 family protein [Breoghania sp. L-A4]|uniref:NlpC/P60 family protein n=1 Tax=Breoghania sp. L-A4 TaxID=2304600 RepID=UPI000E35AD7A|nr:NlpC/P60 family protein [Breoghania sp. L-A4]AXS39969.1 peptidase P60 [Breoghania sp. L-A4]